MNKVIFLLRVFAQDQRLKESVRRVRSLIPPISKRFKRFKEDPSRPLKFRSPA
jgi:hypothetical protein